MAKEKAVKKQWPLFLLAGILAIVLASFSHAHAQLPLSGGESSVTTTSAKQWWDPRQAQRCGRRWCSRVVIPYISSERTDARLIVAVQLEPNTTEDEVIETVERRSDTIEQSFSAVVAQLRRSTKQWAEPGDRHGVDQSPVEGKAPVFWLVTTPKPVNKATPSIEIGKQNNATVVFAVADRDIDLSQQIIATITDVDADNAGTTTQELAEKWKEDLRASLNGAVWGVAFDARYPLGRPILAAGFTAVAFTAFVLLSSLSRLLRDRIRAIQSSLNQLESAAKQAAMNPDGPPQGGADPLAKTEHSSMASNVSRRFKLSVPLRHKRNVFARALRRFGRTVQQMGHKPPQKASGIGSEDYRSLQRIKSLWNIALQLVDLLLLSTIVAGVISVLLIWPSSRTTTLALAQQAILVPLIWLLASLAQLVIVLMIDHTINNWVRDSILQHPGSNRYQMRATTYAKVLKGIGRLTCILFGIYATMLIVGIDPAVLAGAGVVAIAIGFLSRSLLEDIVNGIMILSTDRFAIGDIINVDASGGFVENMNLATTQLRSAGGELITIPNSEIRTVSNLSKDWSRVDFEVEVSADADLRQALAVIRQVADDMEADPEWQALILHPVEILGVDAIKHSGHLLRAWITTSPLKQWVVGREFRLRINEAFHLHGISLGVPHRQIEMHQNRTSETSSGSN
ncbi:mechanosensitive ion channel family protein [Synechococcus sp. CS-602]|uniref:mechanosensitive ion channel family protein n=1 Tax=Synechococcus sp. CS-602 TaxID=2847982 RepID=UPI00223AFCED|nr:mechanosensitive ion channel family protein [Synechococcus sp. CS-602]MCT0205731.1 mechanosensitive ion channel family protein [Synechococcus sp. CS-602]MCT4367748.1 mechanosensitive ion channel family protein [Candidatus Regnicoccus frigidus MAG-AL2]